MKKNFTQISQLDRKKQIILGLFLILIITIIVVTINIINHQQITEKKAGEPPFRTHCDWDYNKDTTDTRLKKLTEQCDGQPEISLIDQNRVELKTENRNNRIYIKAYFDASPNCQYACQVEAWDKSKPDDPACTIIRDKKVRIEGKKQGCPDCLLDIKIWLPDFNKAWDDLDNIFSQLITKTRWANFVYYKIGRINITPKQPPENCPESQCGQINFEAFSNDDCSGSPITPTPSQRGQDHTYNISCQQASLPEGAVFVLHQANGTQCRCYNLVVKDNNLKICKEERMSICCPDVCISEHIDDPMDPYDNDIDSCIPDNGSDCNLEPLNKSCPAPGEEFVMKINTKNYTKAEIEFDDDFRQSKFPVKIGQGVNQRYTYADGGTYDIKLTCGSQGDANYKTCTYRLTAACGEGGGGNPPTPFPPTSPPGGPSPTTPPGGPSPSTPPGGPSPTTPPGGPSPSICPVPNKPVVEIICPDCDE